MCIKKTWISIIWNLNCQKVEVLFMDLIDQGVQYSEIS
jgi:hypothetical protein